VSGARVSVVNLGCRVNRVEADVIASELERAGARLTSESEADAIVINTCAVTGEAEAKTRKAVRHAATLPQAPVVVACGCVANLFSDEVAAIAPNVIVERDKSAVARRVLEALGQVATDADAVADPSVACIPAAPTPLGRMRPGIKIQDGCDNRCTYCIVWKARGASRSLAAPDVVSAVRAACDRGAREVVLTGINLGRYEDASGERSLNLASLIDLLMRETPIGRLRLSSIEPPDVDDELLAAMARHGERVAPFLHVCLQSGCDETLSRMGRVYDTALYRDVVRRAREALPGLALGTDLIVGFPGETDDEFARTLAFCEEMRFAKMHVFRYSRRPGTPAAETPGQVEPRVMAERARRVRDLASAMRAAEAGRLVGTEQLVLVQAPGTGVTGGLFEATLDEKSPVGELVRVRVDATASSSRLVCALAPEH